MKKIFTLAISALAFCAAAQAAESGSLYATTYAVKTQPMQQVENEVYLMYFPNMFSSAPQAIATADATKMTLTIGDDATNWLESVAPGPEQSFGGCTGATVKVTLKDGFPAGQATFTAQAASFEWNANNKTYTNSAAVTSTFEVTEHAQAYDPQPIEVTLGAVEFFMAGITGYDRYIQLDVTPQPAGVNSTKTAVLRAENGTEYTDWAVTPQIGKSGMLTAELSADLPEGQYTLLLPEGFLTYENGDYSLPASVEFTYGDGTGVAGITVESAAKRYTLQGVEIPAGVQFRGACIEVRNGKAVKTMVR